MDEVHMSPRDLAHRWGCAVGTLANMRHYKKGVSYLRLNGGRVAYRLADVEAYEASRLVEVS